MDDLLPIYGCPTEHEATPAFERLVLHDRAYVLRGRAYVPESDHDLVAAYQRTSGEPGNPEADALLAEIERRGLDI